MNAFRQHSLLARSSFNTIKSWWDSVDMIASNGMYVILCTCYYLKPATSRPCVPALLVSGTTPVCVCVFENNASIQK